MKTKLLLPIVLFNLLLSNLLFAQIFAPEISIKNTNGKVGIGSDSFSAKFGVLGQGIQFYSNTQQNTLEIGRNSNENFLIKVDDNHAQLILFQDLDENGPHILRIENRSLGTSNDNDIRLGNEDASSTKQLIIEKNGNVGIGKNNANYKLHVEGNIYYKGGGYLGSDIKLKRNVNDYKKGLSLVKQMRTVTYELKTEADSLEQYNKKHIDKKEIPKYISVVAQELQKIAPELVDYYLDENNEETLAIDITGLTFVMVNSIQDLNASLEEQQAIIESMQREIAKLKSSKK